MARKRCAYIRVDVFAKKPFGGNPLAVFPDARGVTAREMQLLAKEMNLSETTFVLPPSRESGADARVRIFTPDMEIPYAGHPTIGTFYTLAKEGKIRVRDGMTTARMEAGAGVLPVEIHRSKGVVRKVVTVQRKPEFGKEFDDIDLLAEALCVDIKDFDLRKAPPQVVSTGLPWLITPLRTRKAVEGVTVNAGAFAKVVEKLPKNVVDVYTTSLEPIDRRATAHSRGFFMASGSVLEDPATGSASGCLGAYLVDRHLIEVKRRTAIVNEQGFAVGRPSRIEVQVETSSDGAIESIRVGGSVVEVMRGVAEF
ncbi:MAG: PhzF family phenazine biosynthesis protein [Methanobacteriota archaeon]|nr:MAG: PhzF family phenazine biosynthesis protein [Euryarchaeota archaeon]